MGLPLVSVVAPISLSRVCSPSFFPPVVKLHNGALTTPICRCSIVVLRRSNAVSEESRSSQWVLVEEDEEWGGHKLTGVKEVHQKHNRTRPRRMTEGGSVSDFGKNARIIKYTDTRVKCYHDILRWDVVKAIRSVRTRNIQQNLRSPRRNNRQSKQVARSFLNLRSKSFRLKFSRCC